VSCAYVACLLHDAALCEIKLGDVGVLTLTRARDAALKKRLQRDPGKDPQLEKRNKRAEATRERITEKQAAYSVSDRVEQNVRCSPCRSAEEKLHAGIIERVNAAQKGPRPCWTISDVAMTWDPLSRSA
jgi:hypothetical protein